MKYRALLMEYRGSFEGFDGETSREELSHGRVEYGLCYWNVGLFERIESSFNGFDGEPSREQLCTGH